MLKYILIILLLNSSNLLGQTVIYNYDFWLGEDKGRMSDYAYIDAFRYSNSCQFETKVTANLAKGKSRNYFKLVLTGDSYCCPYILGNLSIITKLGNRILCKDRNIRDKVNKNGYYESYAFYYLTSTELRMLENEGIEQVKFSIANYEDAYQKESISLTTPAYRWGWFTGSLQAKD